MSSLADQLRSRHLESDGESPSLMNGGEASGITPQTSSAPSSSAEPVLGDQPVSAAEAPNTPALVIADLPQLGSIGSGGTARSSALPKKWGPSSGSAVGSNGVSGPNTSLGSAPGTDGALGSTPKIIPTKASVLTIILEVPEQKSLVLSAVRDVMSKLGVKIEIANSATPNHATFMIKGASAEKVGAARQELEINLQPRKKIEFVVPSTARAAIIGPRGSNLRSLENSNKVQIELSSLKSQGSWSLERTKVTVEGSANSVSAARKAIFDVVDISRQFSSTRSLPEDCVSFFLYNNDLDSYVNPSKRRITLQGDFDKISQDMQRTDNLLDLIQREYVRKPLTNPADNIRVPDELLRDILQSTGSAVLLSKNEVWGPENSASQAVDMISNYLRSQTVAKLDIAQAHSRDGTHARMLARYFSAKDEISNISNSCGGVFISPVPEITQDGVFYTFSGEEKAVNKARIALKKAVNSRSPSSMCVIRGMRHPLVRKRAEESLKNLSGPVVGFIGPSDELYVEYQEPEDDFAPSEEEIVRHIENAQKELSSLTELANTLTKRKVALYETDAQFALKPVGPQATEIWTEAVGNRDDVGIELTTGSDDTPDAGDANKVTVVLNGTKQAVDNAAEVLPKIISLSKQHAVKASHIEELVIDPQLVRNLIGRNGTQIEKFRDQFDSKIEVDEAGHVRIQGVESQAKACAKAISEFHRRLRDEVTERLQIPSAFHAKLIGPKGKHVRRLTDQHQCLIKFPKTRSGSVDSDSDEGDDSILLRGPSRGVSAIKREFLDLVNYERAQSHAETITVPGAVVSRLVGRGGVGINTIRQDTGTQIDVGSAQNGEEEVEIVVKGEQRSVSAAISQIRKAAEVALDFTEKILEIPQKHHRSLTGPQNSIRRELVAEAGGDAENANRILSIPPQNSTKALDQVRLTGPSSVVSKLEAQILKLVAENERRSQVHSELQVPRNRLGRIVGVEGSKVRETEEKFDVLIDVPRSRGAGNDLVSITVNGEKQEKVDEAIDSLREFALPEDLTVKVPKSVWSPRFRQQLTTKFRAIANPVSGSFSQNQTPPTKPSDSNFLITQSPEIEVQISTKTPEEGKKVAEYLEQYSNSNTLGYLWLLPAQVPAVVGAGGKTIKAIRTETGCSIDVPHSSSNAPISIVGSKENVEAAKDALLQAATK